jgi:hypothetical protein
MISWKIPVPCLVLKADQVAWLHLELDMVLLVVQNIVECSHSCVQIIHLKYMTIYENFYFGKLNNFPLQYKIFCQQKSQENIFPRKEYTVVWKKDSLSVVLKTNGDGGVKVECLKKRIVSLSLNAPFPTIIDFIQIFETPAEECLSSFNWMFLSPSTAADSMEIVYKPCPPSWTFYTQLS